jgi:hypothetical protein
MDTKFKSSSTVAANARWSGAVEALNKKAPDVFSASLSIGRRALAWSLIYLMIPLGVADMFAQEAPPPPPDTSQEAPPPQAYNPLPQDQLNQLVAPIALYPDSLVAQILAASTFPNEIADADAFVQQHPGVPPDQMGQMIDSLNWDPSVKALTAFPTVLANLDKNINWTSQLGNAYYNQPQDVMAAVQVMRQRAYEAGNLRSNQQLAVTYQPNDIVIAPANPTVVYVPYYDPWVVYGTPVVAWGGYYAPPPPPGLVFGVGLAIGFGVGIAVASWNHWGWGWHNWGCGWGNRTVVYNQNVYVSRSVTVVNHGYYGGFDRNVAARNYNRSIAVHAPNYRPGYNGTYAQNNVYRNSYNKTVTNNFYNRTTVNNNVNRTNVNNNRVTTNNNFNRPTPNNNYNRPAPNNGYNRPPATNNTYTRPTTNNNYNRPAPNSGYNRPPTNNTYTPNNNYNRPATNNNYNRPVPTNNNSRPATNNNNYHPVPTNNTRPAMNNSYHPPSNNNSYHPPSNNSYHPASNNNNHPAPQAHPGGDAHPHGGGGDGHPHR